MKFLEAQTRAIEEGKNITREHNGQIEKYRLAQRSTHLRLACVCCNFEGWWPTPEEQKADVWGVE